jgi:hypothetical protein
MDRLTLLFCLRPNRMPAPLEISGAEAGPNAGQSILLPRDATAREPAASPRRLPRMIGVERTCESASKIQARHSDPDRFRSCGSSDWLNCDDSQNIRAKSPDRFKQKAVPRSVGMRMSETCTGGPGGAAYLGDRQRGSSSALEPHRLRPAASPPGTATRRPATPGRTD